MSTQPVVTRPASLLEICMRGWIPLGFQSLCLSSPHFATDSTHLICGHRGGSDEGRDWRLRNHPIGGDAVRRRVEAERQNNAGVERRHKKTATRGGKRWRKRVFCSCLFPPHRLVCPAPPLEPADEINQASLKLSWRQRARRSFALCCIITSRARMRPDAAAATSVCCERSLPRRRA